MITRTWKRRLTLAAVLAMCGCGPQVKIVEPADGSTVDSTSLVAQIQFDAPARTFLVVLDNSDVSNGFFLTNSQAAGVINGLTTGQHVLSVDYLAKSGFEDSDQVIFTVTAPTTLIGIEVSPTTMALTSGEHEPLVVSGVFSDNSTTQDLTDDAATQYESSDSTIATVNQSGRVTGGNAGTATITVTNNGLSATVTVTVTAS
jgi:uncharacterized protein YjdB